jgi:hypothetical protein
MMGIASIGFTVAAFLTFALASHVMFACSPPDQCTEEEERVCLADWLACEVDGLPGCEELYCDCLREAGCISSPGWLMVWVCEEDEPDDGG